MWKIQNYYYAKITSIIQPDEVNYPYYLSGSALKFWRSFWQFSCFYGDSVSQPIEHRQKLAISSEKAKR